MIYIKPKTSINEISETFQTFSEDLTPEPEQLLIVWGDFNIDHSSKNFKFTKLKDFFSSYNLSNMWNVGYTRENAKSKTNIDVVYCSKTVEIEIIKSAVTDRYTVQIVFSDFVRKTVPLKNKIYRDWAVLENHLILEKKVFKIRNKLGRLMSHLYALDCDLAFEKFQEAIIEEDDNYIPLKKSKLFQQPNWIDNSIKNLAAKNRAYSRTFRDTKITKTTKTTNKIRNKLREKIKENKRIYYQKMFHKNAKNNCSNFFNTIKTLSENKRKQKEELSEKQIEVFNIYFTTIGKILSKKFIDPGKNGRQREL